jgi:hypothetical protein
MACRLCIATRHCSIDVLASTARSLPAWATQPRVASPLRTAVLPRLQRTRCFASTAAQRAAPEADVSDKAARKAAWKRSSSVSAAGRTPALRTS